MASSSPGGVSAYAARQTIQTQTHVTMRRATSTLFHLLFLTIALALVRPPSIPSKANDYAACLHLHVALCMRPSYSHRLRQI